MPGGRSRTGRRAAAGTGGHRLQPAAPHAALPCNGRAQSKEEERRGQEESGRRRRQEPGTARAGSEQRGAQRDRARLGDPASGARGQLQPRCAARRETSGRKSRPCLPALPRCGRRCQELLLLLPRSHGVKTSM